MKKCALEMANVSAASANASKQTLDTTIRMTIARHISIFVKLFEVGNSMS